MAYGKHAVRALGAALLLGAIASGGLSSLAAQDATPAAEVAAGRPAHIHTGGCAEGELGDVVAPLTNLVAPEGEAAGQAAGVTAETSVTTVPLALDDILAADHAINIHLSTEEIGTYIACGEIGGVVDANGALVIGLRQVGDSGFSGIAYLAPNAADPASTDVSAFIAEGLDGGAAAGGEDTSDDATAETPAADETPAASAGESVAVSLSDFVIDMPTELAAGTITFEVSNDGEFPHNLEIEGESGEFVLPENLQPGQTGTLEVELEPGTYTVYCPVGQHRENGMELELTVT